MKKRFNFMGAAILAATMPFTAGAQADRFPVPDDAPDPIAGMPGPYPVTLEESAGLPEFTIYMPGQIEGGRESFGVVAWANGGCANDNSGSRAFLKTVASHGFVIVATGAIDSTSEERTHSSKQIEALDWVSAETKRESSPYAGMFEADNAAVMGWSCGGLQSLANATDPRVQTVAIFNSGVFEDPPEFMHENVTIEKDDLTEIDVPVGYFIGGPADIAYPNAVGDVDYINDVPFVFANIQTGHLGTFSHEGGGRFANVAADWLSWTLYGDDEAGDAFEGEECGMCTDPVWDVQRKNL